MRAQSSPRGDEPKTKIEEPGLSRADESMTREQTKKRRGFAAMDRAAVRAIATKGGVAAHVARDRPSFHDGRGAHGGTEGLSRPTPHAWPEDRPSVEWRYMCQWCERCRVVTVRA